MKPKIERIERATHFCRATAKLMLADEQDRYTVMYAKDGEGMIMSHLHDVFTALALEVIEDLVEDYQEDLNDSLRDASAEEVGKAQAEHDLWVASLSPERLVAVFMKAADKVLGISERVLVPPGPPQDHTSFAECVAECAPTGDLQKRS